jgi:membrane-associated phospholipid phosphatase
MWKIQLRARRLPVLLSAALFVVMPAQGQTGDSPVRPPSWRRLVANVGHDQLALWGSPFRAGRKEAIQWGLAGAATGVLIESDKWTARQLPNTADQMRVSRFVSRFGAAYTLAPASLAFYFVGSIRKDDRLRETGLLGAEALANSVLVNGALKMATQRERPLEGNHSGRFFRGAGRAWNSGSSFPSGHATQVWAMAAIVAHEYPRPRIVPIAAYGIASAVAVSRFTARKHFASDVVAGSILGWYIGNYVFHKWHPSGRPSKLAKIISYLGLAGAP